MDQRRSTPFIEIALLELQLIRLHMLHNDDPERRMSRCLRATKDGWIAIDCLMNSRPFACGGCCCCWSRQWKKVEAVHLVATRTPQGHDENSMPRFRNKSFA